MPDDGPTDIRHDVIRRDGVVIFYRTTFDWRGKRMAWTPEDGVKEAGPVYLIEFPDWMKHFFGFSE
jgi:hypothetical protein